MLLSSLPEELLVRILSFALPPPGPRPPIFATTFSLFPSVTLLLVSRQFFRIASPLLYHTLRLHRLHQVELALETLTRRPALADNVRRILFGGIWHECADVLALCRNVQDIDVRISGFNCHVIDIPAEAFCDALEQLHAIKHLTIRKEPALYLTHPRPVYVLQRFAQAIHRWPYLETVHLAVRLTCTPSTTPLAQALSVAPRLRCIRAQLPAVWNTFLLVVSTNPRLEKIMLYAEPIRGPALAVKSNPTTGMAAGAVIRGGDHINGGGDDDDVDVEHAVLSTGLYMMEAKKHARLSELVKAGTSIIRTRAHSTPLGAVRTETEEVVGVRWFYGSPIDVDHDRIRA